MLFQIARLVKVTQTDSPYFKIISPHDVGHKVAPGMDTTFIIQFTPDEKKVCDKPVFKNKQSMIKVCHLITEAWCKCENGFTDLFIIMQLKVIFIFV